MSSIKSIIVNNKHLQYVLVLDGRGDIGQNFPRTVFFSEMLSDGKFKIDPAAFFWS
jgi:hypothetical protein